jgi:hypothetical protein
MRTIEEKKPVVPLWAKAKGAVELSQSLELGYVWKAAVVVQLIESFDAAKYEHDVLGKVP